MFNHLLSKLLEKYYYRLPKRIAQPWFNEAYSLEQKQLSINLLYTLLQEFPASNDSVQATMLQKIAEIIFKEPALINNAKAIDFYDAIKQLTVSHLVDFQVLALVLTLSETDHLEQRAKILFAKQLPYLPRANTVLQALTTSDKATIKSPYILGEAYQNQRARLNGVKELGWLEYRKQMRCMQQGEPHPSFKAKYAFLNDLPSNTFGGALREILHKQKLSLPGEPHGFAEFFIWHDASHVISGNDTSYQGELGTNAFTAGYSSSGKFNILLFGLLQFNLGYDLAVVATPAKNKLAKTGAIEIYLRSLVAGAHSKLDLLNWPTTQMITDLKEDLNLVRKRYNIVAVDQ
jgi:ubiquinone biosynthesis protein Coq4